MNQPVKKDWRELAEQARNEKDPKRLMELIEELNRALDRRNERHNQDARRPILRDSFCLV